MRSRFVSRFVVAALALAGGAAGLVGCGGGGGSGGGSGGAGASSPLGEGGALSGEVSCATDPRVDTYTAKLQKPGTSGALTFELTSSEPAPPAKGKNVFEVSVTDADGATPSGELGVDLYMPDHGHGTSVTPVITTDPATGTFTVDPVYLFMPGVWRVTLSFYADDATSGPAVDQAKFYFCIQG